MSGSQALTATLEDYLEAISRLTAEKGAARVRDIASALSVRKSSVTAALKSLADKGLVNYAPYEITTLTSSGRQVAHEVVRRHAGIRDFLVEVLGVDEPVADENACRLEHAMDRSVFQRLALFAEFVKSCPRTGEDWIDKFRSYFEHGGELPEDVSAAERWLDTFQKKLDRKKQTVEEKPA